MDDGAAGAGRFPRRRGQRQRARRPELHLQGGIQADTPSRRVHAGLRARTSPQRRRHREDLEDSAQSVQKQHLHAQLGHRRLPVRDVTSSAHLQLRQS